MHNKKNTHSNNTHSNNSFKEEHMVRINRWAGVAAGLALAAGLLTACAGGSEEPADGGDETLTIGYIVAGPFDYYMRGVEGAEAAQEALGVEIVTFNSDNKPEKEIANVEDAIAQGVDGLVIFSVGKSSLTADLAKAQAAGIPAVVLYGYDPEIEDQAVAFIQAPADVTGLQAGQWTAENVESGEVAIIQGALGRGDAEAYTAAYEEGIAENPALSLVATVAADWDRAKAQAAMADILTAHPALKTVFVMNEDMALGAVAAIEAAGLGGQGVIVSQNGSPAGIEAVEAGTISATVAWSPAEEAQMALARLVSFLRTGDKPAPVLCNTPTVVVTADNVADAAPWIPTAASTEAGLTAACANG